MLYAINKMASITAAIKNQLVLFGAGYAAINVGIGGFIIVVFFIFSKLFYQITEPTKNEFY